MMWTKSLILFLVFLFVDVQAFSQETITFKVDGKEETHGIKYTHYDTVYGKVRAVFTADTSKVAFFENYRNGTKYGLYRSYYSNGTIREQGVWSKNMRNGEWTWYDLQGEVTTKGVYKEDVKHGFWAYRSIRCYGRFKKGKKNGKWTCAKNTEAECIVKYKKGEIVKGEPCEILVDPDL